MAASGGVFEAPEQGAGRKQQGNSSEGDGCAGKAEGEIQGRSDRFERGDEFPAAGKALPAVPSLPPAAGKDNGEQGPLRQGFHPYHQTGEDHRRPCGNR